MTSTSTKLTLNVYRKNEMNMKNRLLKNGSVSRRCWAPVICVLVEEKKISCVVQQDEKDEEEEEETRISLLCIAELVKKSCWSEKR